MVPGDSMSGQPANGVGVLTKLARIVRQPRRTWQQRLFRQRYIGRVGVTNNCYIAQNCIGGRLYELEGRAYTSPTVGAWFMPSDFLRFCETLEDHLAMEIAEDREASAGAGYPVGRIGAIRIWFQHYPTFAAAREAWTKRASRIQPDKVLVVMSDRDGFSPTDLERFRILPRRKVLLSHIALADADIVHVPGYESDGQVGDLYGAFERLNHPKARNSLFELLRTR